MCMNTMNYHYFEGKNTIPEKLIDLAETMPFLAERRVIVVENSGFFKSAQDDAGGLFKAASREIAFSSLWSRRLISAVSCIKRVRMSGI